MWYGIPKIRYGNGIKNYFTKFPVYRKIRYGIGLSKQIKIIDPRRLKVGLSTTMQCQTLSRLLRGGFWFFLTKNKEQVSKLRQLTKKKK